MDDPLARPPAGNRKNLYILAFSLVVVMLGFGMVIPVFPFYVDRLGASGSALGMLVAIGSLTEFVFGPIWGSVSDQTGRRPILMVGLFGYALSMLLFGLSTELWMLFAARALSGVLSAATMSTAMAYIGDSMPGESRGGGMGLIGASAGVGIIVGPGIGGLLATEALSTPFFVTAGLSLVSLAMVAVLLPESLPPENRVIREGRVGLDSLRELRRSVEPGSPIRSLLVLAFLVTFGTANFESVFGLYMLRRLDYGPESVGAILTVVGVVAILGRGALTGVVTRRWGEVTVIQASMLAGAAGFVFLLLATQFFAVVLATGLFAFSTTFLRPSIHSLTSQRAEGGQGSALGMSNAAVSLGRVFGPLWAGMVFDVNLALPYMSGAAILLLVFLLYRGWMAPKSSRDASTQQRP